MTYFVDHHFWQQRVDQEKKFTHPKEFFNSTIGPRKTQIC